MFTLLPIVRSGASARLAERLRKSHHGVDQLDGHTDIGGLQACVKVGLKQGSVVNSLVEVVSLDQRQIHLERLHLSVYVPRDTMDVACHFLCQYKIGFATINPVNCPCTPLCHSNQPLFALACLIAVGSRFVSFIATVLNK